MPDRDQKNYKSLLVDMKNLKVCGKRAYKVINEVLKEIEDTGLVSEITKARMRNTCVLLESYGCVGDVSDY